MSWCARECVCVKEQGEGESFMSHRIARGLFRVVVGTRAAHNEQKERESVRESKKESWR